jgi:AraC family transcriptional regulator of adaptative response / DNA-3-methyladenine glycosylase II
VISLAYQPPLAWPDLLAFLGGRGAAGVEVAEDGCYRRTVRIGEARGWISVRRDESVDANQLRVEASPGLSAVLDVIAPKLRSLLDLEAQPTAIHAALAGDPRLAPALAAAPGLRVPGAFDGFELVLRAILGQQVTVKAATTLFGRFAARFGERIETPFAALTHLSPEAARIAEARVQELIDLGLTQRRAETIHSVARAVVDGRLRFTPEADTPAHRARFEAIAGIGPWTVSYVAMRALRDVDAFPHGDLALCKALGEIKPREALAISERWRPYRSYAALYLWKSLALHAAGKESGG